MHIFCNRTIDGVAFEQLKLPILESICISTFTHFVAIDAFFSSSRCGCNKRIFSHLADISSINNAYKQYSIWSTIFFIINNVPTIFYIINNNLYNQQCSNNILYHQWYSISSTMCTKNQSSLSYISNSLLCGLEFIHKTKDR